jgi:hypothetical protein
MFYPDSGKTLVYKQRHPTPIADSNLDLPTPILLHAPARTCMSTPNLTAGK